MSKSNSSFFNLKFMGYCMSQMPPEDVGVSVTFDDFVRYAKFQLTLDKGVLMEDKIWESYTDESILVEYFANLFAKSKEERERFETELSGKDPDVNNWFDRMIKKNQEELSEKAAKHEDQIKFVPDALGD